MLGGLLVNLMGEIFILGGGIAQGLDFLGGVELGEE